MQIKSALAPETKEISQPVGIEMGQGQRLRHPLVDAEAELQGGPTLPAGTAVGAHAVGGNSSPDIARTMQARPCPGAPRCPSHPASSTPRALSSCLRRCRCFCALSPSFPPHSPIVLVAGGSFPEPAPLSRQCQWPTRSRGGLLMALSW